MPKKSSPFPMEDAPNYNPDDPFADKVALTDHRHYLLGQHFIKEGRVRVLRKKLEECYATHGVNHFEECTEIRKKYLQATKEVNLNWLDANAWRSDYDPDSPAF